MTSDRELLAALTAAGLAEVDGSTLARSMYASDASLSVVPPRVVVRPREVDDIDAVLSVCRELAVPLTARGAGTSIAGNAVGPGVVIDCSKHLRRVLEIDPEAGWARVEPGVVHAGLQREVLPLGWRFGPDPSTHTRCTIGGMIGNNACGSRALGYGRTSDNVLGLAVTTGTGEWLTFGPHPSEYAEGSNALQDRLFRLVDDHLAAIRLESGRFTRQVSGYSMEHLLPERGRDLASFFVGSEGTLGVIREATVRLVREPAHRVLVVLGFPDMIEAADAVPVVLDHSPVACEGLDSRIIDRVRAQTGRVPDLPTGQGWLLVEIAGDDLGEVQHRATAVARLRSASAAMLVTDPAQAAALWRIREDGAGLVARLADGRQAHAGWEDAAVPPERLGGYLRDFEALLAQHHLEGVPYGHFGDGCLHIRIDFPFERGASGVAAYRSFITDAAALVASHGGSLSGEHGDGRARSGLLGSMYSPELLSVFAGVKDIFDPANLLNPGIIARPEAPETSLRALRLRSTPVRTALAQSDFGAEVHKCTGVGRCRAASTAGVMCPSYLATREEKDSTRGRARVLQTLIEGDGAIDWNAPEVTEALDLCLACKGCLSDCPTGVDMATLKVTVLDQQSAQRKRPLGQRLLGALPQAARLAGHTPRLANAVAGSPLGQFAMDRLGLAKGTKLPAFASSFWKDQPAGSTGGTNPDAGQGKVVTLWIDSFTNSFAPEVGRDALRVLTAAGLQVRLAGQQTCCGLTHLSTGNLTKAKELLAESVAELLPIAAQGEPIVILEPSCAAALAHDGPTFLGTDAARTVASQIRTIAQVLTGLEGWTPPDLTGQTVVAQPHCHHHAVFGWDEDEALLRRAGAELTRVPGCCGMAGNWGIEASHRELSEQIAAQHLLPAIDGATQAAEGADETVVLADGFSCRTQIEALGRPPGRHLASLLAGTLPG